MCAGYGVPGSGVSVSVFSVWGVVSRSGRTSGVGLPPSTRGSLLSTVRLSLSVFESGVENVFPGTMINVKIMNSCEKIKRFLGVSSIVDSNVGNK